jgi:hypothetical protein
MNWRITVILFAILLLLAAILFLVRQPSIETDIELQLSPTPQTLLIKEVTINDVIRLDIADLKNDQFVSFDRSSHGEWSQNNSTSSEIADNTIDSRIVGLINLSSSASILQTEERKLADFGLEEPDAVMVMVAERDDQNVRYAFHLGNKSATSNDVYVLKEGDPRIHAVPGTVIENILALIGELPAQ